MEVLVHGNLEGAILKLRRLLQNDGDLIRTTLRDRGFFHSKRDRIKLKEARARKRRNQQAERRARYVQGRI
jgi:ribosomal protein S21